MAVPVRVPSGTAVGLGELPLTAAVLLSAAADFFITWARSRADGRAVPCKGDPGRAYKPFPGRSVQKLLLIQPENQFQRAVLRPGLRVPFEVFNKAEGGGAFNIRGLVPVLFSLRGFLLLITLLR